LLPFNLANGRRRNLRGAAGGASRCHLKGKFSLSLCAREIVCVGGKVKVLWPLVKRAPPSTPARQHTFSLSSLMYSKERASEMENAHAHRNVSIIPTRLPSLLFCFAFLANKIHAPNILRGYVCFVYVIRDQI